MAEKGRERQFGLAADDACFLVGALEWLDYPFFRNWHSAPITKEATGGIEAA